MTKWRINIIGTLFALGALSIGVVLDQLFPPPLKRADVLSPLVLDQNGEWLHAFTNDEGRWRFEADLNSIDPLFIERLVLVEDKRFRSHFGVDPLAIGRALISSAQAGQIVSGASTITMQTARLLEPRPRTPTAKIIEAFRAFQIERRLTKDEILELYLSLAPYGGNIEGVRAASLVWFGKEPSRLTDAEQALLIALPQAPESRRPDLRPRAAVTARNEILSKLQQAGSIEPSRSEEARNQAVTRQRKVFSKLAWHASRRALGNDQPVVETTINASIQRRAEALVRQYAEQYDDDSSASLLIVENKTASLVAAVGSAGLDTEGGWIDLTRATRSPGSTLKPLIYGLAFDDGKLGPATIIEDMPRAFGDYSPENFDRTFRGEVRVDSALQHSLNLPAVAALESIGARRFTAAVSAAGATLKAPINKEPGLAIALGGAGVTSLNLATLYTGLANGGRVRPLALTKRDRENTTSYRMLSADTARRISSILAMAPSLEGRMPRHLSAHTSAIAFKTGTSYGFRDAWAAGHNADEIGNGYTIIAWVGRADGASRPGATGRNTAAPLLFSAFDLVMEGRDDISNGPIDPSANDVHLPIAQAGTLRRQSSPEIVFPRDGIEIFASESRGNGFALAARGGAGDVRWYIDGEPVQPTINGRTVWKPVGAGFFEVVAVDANGARATSKVRVRTSMALLQ